MARIVKLKFKKTLGSTKVFDYRPLSTQIAVSHLDSDLDIIEPGDYVLLLETKGKKTDVRTYSALQFNQLLEELRDDTFITLTILKEDSDDNLLLHGAEVSPIFAFFQLANLVNK